MIVRENPYCPADDALQNVAWAQGYIARLLDEKEEREGGRSLKQKRNPIEARTVGLYEADSE